MTTAADDRAVDDAVDDAVEEAFEAYLVGRPVADDGAGVAAFATAVRSAAIEPGRPNAALAELLSTGLLVDQSAPSPRTAPSRRRRRLAMFFPALLAKLLSAGAVAQAATGAGVAVVIVASAGAAGVLPDPVQETFSSIVGTETEDTGTVDPAPVDEGTEQQPTDTTGTETTDTETPEVADGTPPTLEEWQQGPDSDSDEAFGAWVSEGARLGYVDGATVSRWAHERNAQRRGGEEEVTTPEPGEDTAQTGDDDGADDTAPTQDTGRRGNGGNGNGGNGNGNGNGHGRNG